MSSSVESGGAGRRFFPTPVIVNHFLTFLKSFCEKTFIVFSNFFTGSRSLLKKADSIRKRRRIFFIRKRTGRLSEEKYSSIPPAAQGNMKSLVSPSKESIPKENRRKTEKPENSTSPAKAGHTPRRRTGRSRSYIRPRRAPVSMAAQASATWEETGMTII